jgi:Domain of unknown function (DUF397)
MRMIHNGIPAASLTEATWKAAGHGEPRAASAEMAALPGGSIAMRNSRDRDGLALIYTHAEIEAFIDGVKAGEFDHLIV